jgi:two-component system, NarL family, sensor histidine kinase BarA
MAETGIFRLSLASKCRLLFGSAVVLIITLALFVPWRSLETLVHDRNLRRAQHLALLARAQLDPTVEDWSRQQSRLDRWWADNADQLGLPDSQPRFIKLPPIGSKHPQAEQILLRFRRASDRLQRLGAAVGRWVPLPPTVENAGIVTGALLAEHRETLSLTGRRFFWQLLHLVEVGSVPLDPFLIKCVRDMRTDYSLNTIPTLVRAPGQPTAYRVALAVRGERASEGVYPLVGLIDMTLEAPETGDVLLWTRVLIVLAGLLAGFLAMLVFYLIVQKLILAPVRDLTEVAGEIAAGDFRARASIATGDEFEEMADAFNKMLSELERGRVELETINRSLDTRLGELAETNVALFEANRMKSEFLANVSHELRTPLTSIIGFADLLRDSVQSDGMLDKSRLARFSHNILMSGRMLLELINDLLDLAKIEAGRIEMHRSRFSPIDICEALSDFMRPLIDKKNLHLELDMAADLPAMHADAGKVRQILYNLLSNAIKYTPEGGTIRLETTARNDGNLIVLTVSDTGPGIAAEDQEKIFEKFRQMDASVTREHGGSGLGLAISRELAHLLGGTIRVESRLGDGARFIVELPTESPESVTRPLSPLS